MTGNNGTRGESHSVAPYNFVSFYKKVIERYKSFEELPSHGEYHEGTLSGYIEYALKAESPIMVSAGKGSNGVHEFFKNHDGKYAIPGSTMRGLLRSNVQILGLSSVSGDIQDNLFLFRGLADKNKKLRDQYNEMIDISIQNKTPGKVRAGYVYKDGKDQFGNDMYIIVEAKSKKGRTFFGIRETKLRLADKKSIGIKYMYNREILKFKFNPNANIRNELNSWYRKLSDSEISGFRYIPYMKDISYSAKYLDNGGINLNELNNDINALPEKGWILCSGFMKKKITHYLINEINRDGKKLELDAKEVRAYMQDLDRKKLDKKSDKYKFYSLPSQNGIENAKPIFYCEAKNHVYFGFTPYLRIFYNYSTLDGIPQELKEERLDYVRSIFGFTGEQKSYKSRVGFTDAVIANKEEVLEQKALILGEPKPTCYPDYIDQTGTSISTRMTYNDNGFKLRGIKQYWLKNSLVKGEMSSNEKVGTVFKPLNKNAEFKGKIYFNNLFKDELGLILWALRLEHGCFHNIGLAKPYGYGRVKVQSINLSIEDLNRKYSSFSFDFYKEDSNTDDYINYYKNFIKGELGGINLMNLMSIKEFLVMKSESLNEEESRYMSIKNRDRLNEFTERNALPTAYEIGKRKNNRFAADINS